MGIANSTFVEAGALPGSAKGWTVVSRCQAERWAAFGSPVPSAYEDFERWAVPRLHFEADQLVLGFFAPQGLGHEGFDHGWSNDLYQRLLAPALAASALFSGEVNEGFVWIAHFRLTWSSVESIGALFNGGGEGGEWFELGWSNNAFRFSWLFVPSTPAMFSGAPVETFQTAWPHAATL
jgi:hypothetical protein